MNASPIEHSTVESMVLDTALRQDTYAASFGTTLKQKVTDF